MVAAELSLRERKKLAAKEKIEKAAQKCFTQEGFERTKVSEIMNEAGLATGTFYNYFNSKEELFRSIMEDKLLGARRFLGDATVSSAPAYDKLTKTLLAAGKVLEEYKPLAAAFFQLLQSGRFSGVTAEHGSFLGEELLELVRKGQSEHELNPSIPPQVVVEVLHSLLESAVFSLSSGMTITENLSYKLLLLLQGIKFRGEEQPFGQK